MICVHDFPRGEVSVKVGIMEFGLTQARLSRVPPIMLQHMLLTNEKLFCSTKKSRILIDLLFAVAKSQTQHSQSTTSIDLERLLPILFHQNMHLSEPTRRI